MKSLRLNLPSTSPSLRSDLAKKGPRDPIKTIDLWRRLLSQFGEGILQGILATRIHPADAEEVFDSILDKLEKILPNFSRDESKGSMRQYLYRVTFSQVKQHYRKKKRRPFHFSIDPSGCRTIDLTDTSPSDEEAAKQQAVLDKWQENCAILRQAMDKVAASMSAEGKELEWIIFRRGVEEGHKPRDLANEFEKKVTYIYQINASVKNMIKSECRAIASSRR